MSDRNYPLPVTDDDPRFTFGLMLDVAAVLVEHGYPRPHDMDFAEVQHALFRFLYVTDSRVEGGQQ